MSPTSHPKSFNIKSLIKRDGKINVHGHRKRKILFTDLYHYLLSLTWPRFFITIGAFYIVMNLAFAILYFLCGVDTGELHASFFERFEHCVFLSIETLTAIEFGRIHVDAVVPDILMTIQAICGILTIAMIAGLSYGRFARPTARVIFSNKAIIATYNSKPCLSFRVANERLNQIAEARMTLTLTKNETSHEGETSRRFYELKLERDYSPIFALSWTVRHFIDEKSPLFGMTHSKLQEAESSIIASLTGVDETFAQPIIARHAYIAEDIVYNTRFKDIIIWRGQKVHIDLTAIHDVHEVGIKEKD